MSHASAPNKEDILKPISQPLEAPVFHIDEWNTEEEPLGLTRLKSGESFLHGVKRISSRIPGPSPVSKGCKSLLPGMRVAQDQVGILLKNGSIHLRPPGAYRTIFWNPWKRSGAVVPINRKAGVEFDPLQEAASRNRFLRRFFSDLGQSYRQVVLQPHQIAIFEDQTKTFLVTNGTYVYDPETSLRGVVDLNNMEPVIVERETEDTASFNATPTTRYDQHGRIVPANQAHGTTVMSTKRYLPSGYTKTVAGISFARPEKGFVVLHKSASNKISMTEGICIAAGKDDFVRRAKTEARSLQMDDLVVEFGDLNHYAKSTPVLELKSKDNMDALCRVQIKWKQDRPDVWISYRGAFTDPFDMLEEKCANMMRDWLLSVTHIEALSEKSHGFTKVEFQWMSELNDTGREYGVSVLGIEITVMRFPHIDSQDEKMAIQLAQTNLELESQRQKALKEQETSKLNQATHNRMQEDRDREAEALERLQAVERRKNIAEVTTITEKAKMDTEVVKAEMELSLVRENKDKAVFLAKAYAETEAEKVRAEGKRIASQLAAEGEIAATKEKNNAQIAFLKEQAALLKENPGLLELLKIQNDLLKTESISRAATINPNVVLLPGLEGLEARRMNKGYAPQVPGAAIIHDSNQ
jgi:hypothetical protein